MRDGHSLSDNNSYFNYVIPSEDRDDSQPKQVGLLNPIHPSLDDSEFDKQFVKNIQAFDLLESLTNIKNEAVSTLKDLWNDLTSKEEAIKDVPPEQVKPEDVQSIQDTKKKVEDAKKQVAQTTDKITDLKQELSSDTKPDDSIRQFQQYLSKSNPVIGTVYSGPIDGIVNKELISAAKKVESYISSSLGNNDVYGMLWNDSKNTFNTTVGDLSESLSLLSNNKVSHLVHSIKKESNYKELKNIYSKLSIL